MYLSLQGNISRLLTQAADKTLSKEWEAHRNCWNFRELVEFQHRVGVKANERRQKITEENRSNRSYKE